MEAKDHVSKLADALTSTIEGFKPDGPFLIRVAVLVRVFTILLVSRLTRVTANHLRKGIRQPLLECGRQRTQGNPGLR